MYRSPTRAIIGNETPEEIRTGKRPDLRHLKVFGVSMAIHIPKIKRRKFTPKVTKSSTVVGYCEDTKGYRVYCPESIEIIVIPDKNLANPVPSVIEDNDEAPGKDALKTSIEDFEDA